MLLGSMPASPARVVARAVVLALLAGLVYLGITFAQVWQAAGRDEAQPAGAIVVLGAAQYDGVPSPVLRARLEHAVTLYRADIAPLVVVTGSNRPGDRTTEASASASYLHLQGIADEVIRREVGGTNTYDQLAATARFLRREGVSDVVLVSDPLHSHRLALTAEEVGLEARISPRTVRMSSPVQQVRSALRETAAIAAGRVVGFRRLRNLREDVLRPTGGA